MSLHYVTRQGELEIAKKLLFTWNNSFMTIDNNKRIALYLVITRGHHGVISELLEQGTNRCLDVNKADNAGLAVLHLTSRYGLD